MLSATGSPFGSLVECRMACSSCSLKPKPLSDTQVSATSDMPELILGGRLQRSHGVAKLTITLRTCDQLFSGLRRPHSALHPNWPWLLASAFTVGQRTLCELMIWRGGWASS